MNKNTILVVMPIYNAEATLAMAIESILGQTYPNIYLTLVDDCSSDQSHEIAKGYAKKYKNINVVSNNKNMGAYYSRNLGLYINREFSWGFFTTHDADDVSFPSRYQDLLTLLRSKPKVNGVQEMFERVELATGRVLSSKFTMAHALFTREVFNNLGYFDDSRFGADWEYWARLKEFNKQAGFFTDGVAKVTGISYVHGSNLTVQIPIHSPRRSRYVAKATRKIRKQAYEKDFYKIFEPQEGGK